MTARAVLEHGGMIVHVEGDYSPGEVRHAVVGGLFSQEFQLPGAMLFDSRRARAAPTSELLDESLKLLRALFQNGIASRCAVIAAKDRVPLARDLQTLLREAGNDLEILTTLEEGKAWLKTAAAHTGV